MVVRLYAVWDRLAEEFGPPAEFPTDAAAQRAFADALAKMEHKEDYVPMFLGTYDKGTGELRGAPHARELEPGQLELELKVVK